MQIYIFLPCGLAISILAMLNMCYFELLYWHQFTFDWVIPTGKCVKLITELHFCYYLELLKVLYVPPPLLEFCWAFTFNQDDRNNTLSCKIEMQHMEALKGN